jgi:hypothetical protein
MKTTGRLFVAAVTLLAAGHAGAADIPTKMPPTVAVQPAPFFIINDNSFSYYYAPTATNPGAGKTPKNVLSFVHFDVWAYGTNFFQVDWLKATNGKNPPQGTPAAPCDQGGALHPPGVQQCSGYTEIYGLFRSAFGWNQIFNTQAFKAGPLVNIAFAVGADANTDNTSLGSAKRSIQGGLQFDFAAPYKGFVNVGVFAYKEWQNDGFAALFPFQAAPNPSGKVNFDTTWAVEMNYAQPIGFLPASIPLTYKAFVSIHGPKGCGEVCAPLGPGLVRTNEYLTQQTLNLDVGEMVWGKRQQFIVWGGYRWWKNKFGIDPNQPGGPFPFTLESTWLVGTTLTF